MPKQIFNRTPVLIRNHPVKELPYPIKLVGIDKLRLCIQKSLINDEQLALIIASFNELRAEGAQERSSKAKAFNKRLVMMIDGSTVLFECSATTPQHPYQFAVDFNPNHFHGEKFGKLQTLFRRVLGLDAHHLLSHAVVTRIDVNIDIAYDLSGLLISAKHKRSGLNVQRIVDGHGTLGSVYFGDSDSSHIRCYDKAQESIVKPVQPHRAAVLAALASGNGFPTKLKKVLDKSLQQPLWRMEVVNVPKPPVRIRELSKIAHCFDDLKLSALPMDVPAFSNSLGKLFVALAGYEGIEPALQRLDVKNRRHIKTALANHPPVEWWNNEQYAACIMSALARLMPLFEPPRLPVAPPPRTPVARPHVFSSAPAVAAVHRRLG